MFVCSSTNRPKRSDWSCDGTRRSRSARTTSVSAVLGGLRTFRDEGLTSVSADMKLSPNVGSDRSWVWNVHADYAEGEPSPETLAIRFGNSDSGLIAR